MPRISFGVWCPVRGVPCECARTVRGVLCAGVLCEACVVVKCYPTMNVNPNRVPCLIASVSQIGLVCFACRVPYGTRSSSQQLLPNEMVGGNSMRNSTTLTSVWATSTGREIQVGQTRWGQMP
jgi:hypothetical protein